MTQFESQIATFFGKYSFKVNIPVSQNSAVNPVVDPVVSEIPLHIEYDISTQSNKNSFERSNLKEAVKCFMLWGYDCRC